jgi:hypothetical protein
MKPHLVSLLFLVLSLAASAPAQMMNDYLDVGIVTVKPEKRGEFEAIIKKMVDANRRHRGDHWLTTEMMFGPGNTFTYVSPRQNYAGVEQAYGSFMGAMEKSLGAAGSAKLMQDFSNCLSSTRGEFRRRRWDLSANAPTSESAMNQLVGPRRHEGYCCLRSVEATGAALSPMANRCLSPRTKIIPSEIAGVAINTSPIAFEASSSY